MGPVDTDTESSMQEPSTAQRAPSLPSDADAGLPYRVRAWSLAQLLFHVIDLDDLTFDSATLRNHGITLQPSTAGPSTPNEESPCPSAAPDNSKKAALILKELQAQLTEDMWSCLERPKSMGPAFCPAWLEPRHYSALEWAGRFKTIAALFKDLSANVSPYKGDYGLDDHPGLIRVCRCSVYITINFPGLAYIYGGERRGEPPLGLDWNVDTMGWYENGDNSPASARCILSNDAWDPSPIDVDRVTRGEVICILALACHWFVECNHDEQIARYQRALAGQDFMPTVMSFTDTHVRFIQGVCKAHATAATELPPLDVSLFVADSIPLESFCNGTEESEEEAWLKAVGWLIMDDVQQEMESLGHELGSLHVAKTRTNPASSSGASAGHIRVSESTSERLVSGAGTELLDSSDGSD